jgi:hypothetical protein
MMLFLCFHMLQITQGKREASYVLICCSSRKIKSVASLLTYRYALQQLEDKNCTYSTYCCYLDIWKINIGKYLQHCYYIKDIYQYSSHLYFGD